MSARRRHVRGRGFTLVELMVALSGGLFLSMVVFTLARDSNRFYQQQTRLANATLSGIVGFDRLRADIARAGFLTTPNIMADPHVCTQPTAQSPARLQVLRSLWLTVPTAAVSTTLEANGIRPMTLDLAGAYTSSDEFPIRTVSTNGTVTSVFLQVNTGPMARLGYSPTATLDQQNTLLSSVFGVNRILRLVDKSGSQHYGVIQSVTGGDQPVITLLDATQALTFRAAGGTCGLKGLEVGATANVVNLIRYEVRSVSADADYAPLFNADAGTVGPFDNDRTELVRVERDADGTPIAGTLELVAEYAVDFQLSFTAWNNGVLTTIAPDNTNFATYFPTSETSPANVQWLRALRARLSVRSREADRGSDVDTSLSGLYRIGLGPSGTAPFARVRTFQADIALHNHGRTQWQ